MANNNKDLPTEVGMEENEVSTNYFEDLYRVDVSDKVEKKNGLSYLSWTFAWAELKKRHPDASYTIYENAQGWNYHTDGRTCWVKVGVTVNGLEHIDELPIMDFKNRSIPLENITSFEVNKTIQRSLTKCIGRHGLGLYVYAGEDLPEESDGKNPVKGSSKAKTAKNAPAPEPTPVPTPEPAGDKYDAMSPRKALVAFCTDNGIDINSVCQTCSITNQSPDEVFKDALSYARGLVR